MNKLIVVILGQDCENTIGMCLKSVQDADEIIYLDGGSKDKTLDIWDDVVSPTDDGRFTLLRNTFNKLNPNAISEQRNFYLDYLKKNHMGDICLVIDADEVVDNLKHFSKWKNRDDDFIESPQMRHLMYTLGYEDNSQEIHNVPNRFFKITEDLYYPEGEHTILSYTNPRGDTCSNTGLIWHLGYLGGVWDVKKRYDQQILRNSGHTKQFLNQWNKSHVLGRYPVKHVDIEQLPNIILENFGMNPEEIYFEQRGKLEAKHGVFVKQWNELFKPKTVAEFGCGRGLYLYYWEMCCKSIGYELSDFAIKNKICTSEVQQFELGEHEFTEDHDNYDLVTAIDVLEHLRYDKIDDAIGTLIGQSKKYILTSIPYKGTPNCERDKTHIIKESRDWWISKFVSKGLKEVEVPTHWIFKEQLLIFEK